MYQIKNFTIMSDDSYFDDEFPLDEIAVNKDLDLLKLAYRNELVLLVSSHYL